MDENKIELTKMNIKELPEIKITNEDGCYQLEVNGDYIYSCTSYSSASSRACNYIKDHFKGLTFGEYKITVHAHSNRHYTYEVNASKDSHEFFGSLLDAYNFVRDCVKKDEQDHIYSKSFYHGTPITLHFKPIEEFENIASLPIGSLIIKHQANFKGTDSNIALLTNSEDIGRGYKLYDILVLEDNEGKPLREAGFSDDLAEFYGDHFKEGYSYVKPENIGLGFRTAVDLELDSDYDADDDEFDTEAAQGDGTMYEDTDINVNFLKKSFEEDNLLNGDKLDIVPDGDTNNIYVLDSGKNYLASMSLTEVGVINTDYQAFLKLSTKKRMHILTYLELVTLSKEDRQNF